MSRVKNLYRSLPVNNRVGEGVYTYQFIVESDDNVVRNEIFANNLASAIFYASQLMNMAVVNQIMLDNSTCELFFAQTLNSNIRYYLFTV